MAVVAALTVSFQAIPCATPSTYCLFAASVPAVGVTEVRDLEPTPRHIGGRRRQAGEADGRVVGPDVGRRAVEVVGRERRVMAAPLFEDAPNEVCAVTLPNASRGCRWSGPRGVVGRPVRRGISHRRCHRGAGREGVLVVTPGDGRRGPCASAAASTGSTRWWSRTHSRACRWSPREISVSIPSEAVSPGADATMSATSAQSSVGVPGSAATHVEPFHHINLFVPVS